MRSQVDLSRPRYVDKAMNIDQTNSSVHSSNNNHRMAAYQTPKKERLEANLNDHDKTGRVKDLLKLKKLNLEKIFTKFNNTHHQETSPLKKINQRQSS